MNNLHSKMGAIENLSIYSQDPMKEPIDIKLPYSSVKVLSIMGESHQCYHVVTLQVNKYSSHLQFHENKFRLQSLCSIPFFFKLKIKKKSKKPN